MEPFGSALPAVADVSLLKGGGESLSAVPMFISSQKVCLRSLDCGLSGDVTPRPHNGLLRLS